MKFHFYSEAHLAIGHVRWLLLSLKWTNGMFNLMVELEKVKVKKCFSILGECWRVDATGCNMRGRRE